MRWRRHAWVLLFVPLILLWVPFYNRIEPSFAGIPFFYWYQVAWVPVTVILTFVVYRLERRAGS